jgi:hypothetical protein
MHFAWQKISTWNNFWYECFLESKSCPTSMDILGFSSSHSETLRLSFVSRLVHSLKTGLLAGVPLRQIQFAVIWYLHKATCHTQIWCYFYFYILWCPNKFLKYIFCLFCFCLLSCVLLFVLCYLCLNVVLFLLLAIRLLTCHVNKQELNWIWID